VRDYGVRQRRVCFRGFRSSSAFSSFLSLSLSLSLFSSFRSAVVIDNGGIINNSPKLGALLPLSAPRSVRRRRKKRKKIKEESQSQIDDSHDTDKDA
jgi:hypothetical protein